MPLPESASGWFLSYIADDVVVLTDRAGRAVHYRPSTQLATSHSMGPRYHFPLSPRLAIPAVHEYETFFRSTDPERGLPLPVRVVGLCRETKDGSAIAVRDDAGWAHVRKNAHCTVVLLGHMHGDASGDYIAGGGGQGKLVLFWRVPLGTSLDILLGSGRERDARAPNASLVKALRLGTVRVLLGSCWARNPDPAALREEALRLARGAAQGPRPGGEPARDSRTDHSFLRCSPPSSRTSGTGRRCAS